MSDTPRSDLDLHWIEAHGLRLNHQYVSYVLAQDLERQLNEARELLGMIYRDRDYGGFTTTSKSGLSDDDFEKLRLEILQKGIRNE